MPSLPSLSLADLLDAFSSASPTPGGGSAAAVAGALGAALLAMVARLPRTRTGAPAEAAALAQVAGPLLRLRDRLSALADEDSAAYDAVTAAYRLPKGTDREKAVRGDAVRAAMRGATDVPLETMRACGEALGHAVTVARSGNRHATSDAAAGVHLVVAATAAADGNVRINLASLPEDEYRAGVAAEADRVRTAATAHAAEALKALA